MLAPLRPPAVGCVTAAVSPSVCPASVRRPSRRRVATKVVDPNTLAEVVQQGLVNVADQSSLVDVAQRLVGLPLLYEPVALPCSLYRCGDVVHRSTLDLALRGELLGPDWRTWLLLATVGTYLLVPPGVLPGAVDYYWITRFRSQHAYIKDDVTLGRKLATGGFGTVFRGEMKLADGQVVDVIVKKAKEFGQAEAWMNERMMRLPGKHCAEFITAFDETLSTSVMPLSEARAGKKKPQAGPAPVWLVWRYEGDNNLYDLMEKKDFPYNLEPLLLNRELQLPEGVQRKAVTIKVAMKQLLEALAAAHNTGIVHRDIKPQNCIISERDKKIKLIDLGAAADLRVGINYVPSEYLLDPRYAPPQQYVMSTQTPNPPPAPVAAFLSPILWRMENPDRFDMWACGVTLLQMAFPGLRSDNAIIAFNKKLEDLKWDLRAWRAQEERRRGGVRPDLAEGFQLLDLDNGAGWNLACSLMAYKPADRCSASEALLSPFFTGLGITAPTGPIAAVAASQSMLSSVGKALSKSVDPAIMEGLTNAATGKNRGSLTEAQLRQELGLEEAAPIAPRAASNTIVWWKERQSQMQKSIERREGTGGSSGLPMRGSKSRSRSSTPPASSSASSTPAPAQGSWLVSPFKGKSGKAAVNGNGDGVSNGNEYGNGKPRVANGKPAKVVAAAQPAGSQGVVASNGAGARKPLAGLLGGLARSKSPEPASEDEEEREVELVGNFLGMLKGNKASK